MPRRATSLPLTLPARSTDAAAYRWLYSAIRSEIVHGHLEPGYRLPATRDLARQYGLSRGTVVAAFELLQAEGYVDSAVGSGTRVSQALPASWRGSRGAVRARAVRPRQRQLSAKARRVTMFRVHPDASGRAFRANQPALDVFPLVAWAQASSRVFRRAQADLLNGCEPMGYRPLRAAIAEYLSLSRGVVCDPDHVAVVSGTQEALNVVATLLVDPEDVVCMEDPGYGGATGVMRATGARVHPVPVDDDGACVPSTRVRAKLAYLTPAHQFPLGVCMPMTRRLQWLGWARTVDAVIFEDDYDSEFRYSGRPVSALQGLDRDGSVVFAGSFSKVLCPSLRLGYLVVPPDLVDPVAAMLSVASRHASAFSQAVLCEFMATGQFARHLRRMREVYAERHDALLRGARRWLDGRLDVRPVDAGLQTVGYLPDGWAASEVVTAAAARGVEVVPLGRYATSPLVRDGLQLGFAAVPPAEIARGVQGLARVLEPRRATRAARTREAVAPAGPGSGPDPRPIVVLPRSG